MKKIKETFDKLDKICNNENLYTDEELAIKFNKIFKSIPINYLISHIKTEKLLKKRVKKYCKKHKIKLEEYCGVLPYRKYSIKITK